MKGSDSRGTCRSKPGSSSPMTKAAQTPGMRLTRGISAADWHSARTHPPAAATMGRYLRNWMVSPNPCSPCTRMRRPASGEPSQRGWPKPRAGEVKESRRQRHWYSRHPSRNSPQSSRARERFQWASAQPGSRRIASRKQPIAPCASPPLCRAAPRAILASMLSGARSSEPRKLSAASGNLPRAIRVFPMLLSATGSPGLWAKASRYSRSASSRRPPA